MLKLMLNLKFRLRYWLMSHISAFFMFFCDRKKGGETMRLLYVKPELRDLSQGSIIAFVGLFMYLTKVCLNVIIRYIRMWYK